MKFTISAALFLIAACALCSQTPRSKFQTQTLEDRLATTQVRLDKMIANHNAVMARMKKIEDALDEWTKRIHDARKSLAGK